MGWLTAFVLIPAALLCYALILVLMPLLQRYALARPNARSSHTAPTPQGGGIAVIVSTLTVATAVAAVITFGSGLAALSPSIAGLLPILAGATLLAIVGAVDDLRPLGVAPRLLLQLLAVLLVIETLPEQFRILPFLPAFAEHALLIVTALWFVNLTNFMDGLDWMTVAQIVPVTIALALFGSLGQLPPNVTIVALALAGAMIGFAPFNRPVARLFLGDVGSLPIGLLTGWMLLELAGRGHLVAAILLPLYYLGDATITLLRRASRGEKVWAAHRSHFYQQATDNGFSVLHIVGTVFALNVALAAMAALSIALDDRTASAMLLLTGVVAVGLTLRRFSKPRR